MNENQGGSRARCQAFTFKFDGIEVERVQSNKYLGFDIHATKSLIHVISKLIPAANKALHAMNRIRTILGPYVRALC